MEKGINLRINEFKQSIANYVNKSELPPGIVQLVLQGALNEVINLNANAIICEQAELEKAGEKDGESVQ